MGKTFTKVLTGGWRFNSAEHEIKIPVISRERKRPKAKDNWARSNWKGLYTIYENSQSPQPEREQIDAESLWPVRTLADIIRESLGERTWRLFDGSPSQAEYLPEPWSPERDPLEHYLIHRSGQTRGQIHAVDHKLYKALWKSGKLKEIPLSTRERYGFLKNSAT